VALTVLSATHSQQPLNPERSVLSHAASAWRGFSRFTTVDDRQRLEAVILLGIRSSFCSADQAPLSSELVETADDHVLKSN